jgi:hypothetical protein
LVLQAVQVAVDEVAGDRHAASIGDDPDGAAELVIENREARSIRRDRRCAAQVAALDSALVADQALQTDGAVEAAALDVHEVGAIGFERAAYASVTRRQRAALEQDHVAADIRPRELARSRDAEVTTHLHLAESGRARHGAAVLRLVIIIIIIVVALRAGASAEQHQNRKDDRKRPAMICHGDDAMQKTSRAVRGIELAPYR